MMKVAVLGFGTVGYGVYEMLKNVEGLEPGPVLVRPGKEDEPFKVSDIGVICGDPEVGAVAEVMGGVEPAFSYASAVLKAGKHFVTSNKALVAAKGAELAALAEENNVAFLFSAACGGGVPFLHNMALAVQSDEILSVGGILNGTTNYMLDAMQRRSMSYQEALADAQKLGYAEADPTADVTGLDALRKIMLACAVAFGKMPVDGLNNEGIDSFTSQDVDFIKQNGLTARLIVSGEPSKDGKLAAYVEPVLFEENAPECSVLANFNMAKYNGKNSGRIVLMGQGAGRWPTASAVLRDLSDILCGRKYMMSPSVECVTADNSSAVHRYLISLPEGTEAPFKIEKYQRYGDRVYMFTQPLSVSEMHAAAKKLRSGGMRVFFAAIGE